MRIWDFWGRKIRKISPNENPQKSPIQALDSKEWGFLNPGDIPDPQYIIPIPNQRIYVRRIFIPGDRRSRIWGFIFPGIFLNLGTFIPGIGEFENLGIFMDWGFFGNGDFFRGMEIPPKSHLYMKLIISIYIRFLDIETLEQPLPSHPGIVALINLKRKRGKISIWKDFVKITLW